MFVEKLLIKTLFLIITNILKGNYFTNIFKDVIQKDTFSCNSLTWASFLKKNSYCVESRCDDHSCVNWTFNFLTKRDWTYGMFVGSVSQREHTKYRRMAVFYISDKTKGSFEDISYPHWTNPTFPFLFKTDPKSFMFLVSHFCQICATLHLQNQSDKTPKTLLYTIKKHFIWSPKDSDCWFLLHFQCGYEVLCIFFVNDLEIHLSHSPNFAFGVRVLNILLKL